MIIKIYISAAMMIIMNISAAMIIMITMMDISAAVMITIIIIMDS